MASKDSVQNAQIGQVQNDDDFTKVESIQWLFNTRGYNRN